VGSIDFIAVKRLITLVQVLDALGYEPVPTRRERWSGPCPLGCSTHPRGASFDKVHNVWHCHKCGKGGNHFDLYATSEGLTLYAAAIELCKTFNVEVPLLPSRNGGRSHGGR